MIYLETWLVLIKNSDPHFAEIGGVIVMLLLQKTAHENVEKYTDKRCNKSEGVTNV